MDMNLLDLANLINIENEIRIHIKLIHKHIVRMYDFFPHENYICIILELCPLGNLFRYLNSFTLMPEQEIFKLFRETCLAIQHLHSQHILQRDLKPENILLSEKKEAKMCDFGWAIEQNYSEYSRARAGTCAYMSPEALRGEFQTLKTDIWALGVLLYELYHNIEPYQSSNINQQLAAILNTTITFHNRVGDSARKLILDCLQLEPSRRPTIHELLRHQYFAEQVRQEAQQNKVACHSIEPRKP